MATKAQKKLALRLKRVRRERALAEMRHKRAVAAFKKTLRAYRAA